METKNQIYYRYFILFFAFFLCLINYLDRAVIAYAVKPIEAYFHIGNTLFGLSISLFALGTLCVNWIAGVLVDHYTPRRVWLIALPFWSLMMVVLGFSFAFWFFLVFRFLLGVGEGVNFPTLDRAVFDWVGPDRINKAFAFTLLGVPLASLIGSPVISSVIIHFNWRVAFIALGILGFILVVIWGIALYCFSYPKQPYWHLLVEKKKQMSRRESWSAILSLFKNPALLSMAWSFFAFGYVLFFAISWLPGYFEQSYDLHLRAIGWFLMLPWGMSCVSILLGGVISDYLMKKTNSVRISRVHFTWLCQLIGVLFLVPLFFVHNITLAIICLSFSVAFELMPNAAYYSYCADISPTFSGSTCGIIVSFFSLSGVVSPLLTGWLSGFGSGFIAPIIALIVVVASAILGLWFFAYPHKYRLLIDA